jgi:ribonucleoside-diphosphate reductase alpha chain
LNNRVFKYIREELDDANLQLGKERGEAPDAVGTGKRFSHMLAIAPNASSSIIMGNTSPSVEPYRANAYRQDTLSGAFLNKNKFLIKSFRRNAMQTNHWDIKESGQASLQMTVPFNIWTSWMSTPKMSTKLVWKLTKDGLWTTPLNRQRYIDQAQSINLFFRPDVNVNVSSCSTFSSMETRIENIILLSQ